MRLPTNILEGIRRGDSRSFDSFYAELSPKLTKFAFSYVRDWNAAESLVQDAFVKLWEKREDLQEDVNLPAYITTILKNSALNFLKRKKIENEAIHYLADQNGRELDMNIDALSAYNPDNIFAKEIDQLLKSCVESLPPQTRQVFKMSRYDYMSHKEIAMYSRLSEKGVEYHISKALRILKDALKDYLPLAFLLFPHFF